jgi:hypothetical protein
MNPEREKTRGGLPEDIETSVLKLCMRAFQEEDYLLYVNEPKDVGRGDLVKARLNDLPALRVWVQDIREEVNQTGAALGRKQREALTFRVVIAYCVDYALARDGDDLAKRVGWGLREKLAENTTLFGLAHRGADIVSVDFESDLVNLNDQLYVADCAKLVIDYKLLRMKKRSQGRYDIDN